MGVSHDPMSAPSKGRNIERLYYAGTITDQQGILGSVPRVNDMHGNDSGGW